MWARPSRSGAIAVSGPIARVMSSIACSQKAGPQEGGTSRRRDLQRRRFEGERRDAVRPAPGPQRRRRDDLLQSHPLDEVDLRPQQMGHAAGCLEVLASDRDVKVRGQESASGLQERVPAPTASTVSRTVPHTGASGSCSGPAAPTGPTRRRPPRNIGMIACRIPCAAQKPVSSLTKSSPSSKDSAKERPRGSSVARISLVPPRLFRRERAFAWIVSLSAPLRSSTVRRWRDSYGSSCPAPMGPRESRSFSGSSNPYACVRLVPAPVREARTTGIRLAAFARTGTRSRGRGRLRNR